MSHEQDDTRSIASDTGRAERLMDITPGEEKLSVALDAGGMGWWEIDIPTRTLDASPNCKANYGRLAEEPFSYEMLLGQIHPEDLPYMQAAVLRSLEAGHDYDIEYRCIWPDGSVHVLQVRGRLRRDARGEPSRMIGVSWEVTAQRAMEAALRMSEAALRDQTERVRIAQEAGQVGVFEWFPETGSLTVSDAFRRLWGLPAHGEVNDAQLVAQIHPDDTALAGPSRIGIDPNPLQYAEYRIFRADTGEERWIARRGEVRTREGEESRRFVGVVIDITERKHAEAALRESEERFRLIADASPVPMWVSKLGGKREFVNKAYCELLGAPYRQAVDYDWRDLLHPDDLPRILKEQVAGESSHQPFTLEARYRLSDGEWHWLRSQSQPRWGPDGAHIGFIGVAHDVTVAKQAEAELRGINDRLEERVAAALAAQAETEDALRQAQKMEAVGQLTGGIAHDFNNLLTPVIGGLEIVAAGVTDPRHKRLAVNALEAARRAAKLTGQLLAFSRVQKLSVKPVDVGAQIGQMIDLMRRTLGPGVTIRSELDGDAGFAMCDPYQLENAVLNLAINARDAMPGGGTLTLSARRAVLEGGVDHKAGDYVAIAVEDTGTGMTHEVLERAVEPFFTTKPFGEGTGLGLAQVYGVAHQSGGTVKIDSAVGVGTAVSIYLPAADLVAMNEPVATGQAGRGARRRAGTIMLVDDDDDVRGFLQDVLGESGYVVTALPDGETCLADLEGHAPDLLMLDFAMPGLNGAETALMARLRHPDLPIVLVTGYADSDALDKLAGDGAVILRKPFEQAELMAAIDAALKPAGRV
jgi:PAS domain S-box-containing protein